jgi:hypothetical protein
LKSFGTAKEIDDFVKQAFRDSEIERGELADYQSKCRCYYLGAQWISNQRPGSRRIEQAVDRAFPNYAAEQGPLRAVVNRTTRNTIYTAAATNPSKIDVDAMGSSYNVDSDVRAAAFAGEALANQIVDKSGMLAAARLANFERTVGGIQGLGVRIEHLGDGDKCLKCFTFDACRLALDPGNPSIDLMDHDYVIYEEIITISKLKLLFGEEWVNANIDEKLMSTVGQMMPREMHFNRISGGDLYQRYAQQSSTKAAKVNWLYCKDRYNRFGRMYVTIDANQKEPLWVNESDSSSPYGGCGLPFVLLRGHLRPGTRKPISDIGMMMGDQDRLNLMATLWLQQAYDYTAGYQWLVDQRAFGRNKSDEDHIARELSKRVVLLDGSSSASRPERIVPNEPSANMDNMMRLAEDDVRQGAFRSEASKGALKSHVTTENFTRTQEQTELPLDDRVSEDVAQYERLIQVMVGTSIAMLQRRMPYMAKLATNAGLSDFELGMVASLNPNDLPFTIRLRNQAIRRQSRSQRRQNLIDAVTMQAVLPEEMRFVMAEELDLPLSEGDKRAAKFALQTAVQVRDGEEYVPLDVGEYGGWIIRAMRFLLMEDRTSQIDGARARLDAAIAAQREFEMQIMAEMQGGQPQAQGAPQPDPMQSMSIEQMLQGAQIAPQTFA